MPLPRVLVIVLVAVVGLTSCGDDGSVAGVAEQDRPLPRLMGETLDGDPIHAARYADGDVLVINVWATNCPPCRREQPELVALAERYADRGVRFLGINYFDDRDAARAWEESYGVPYPSLYDPSGRTAASLGYPFLPDTYVVDPGGTIRWVVFGQTDARELRGLIDHVLTERD